MEKVLSWREIFNITWINANKRVEELVFQGINTCLNEWEGLSVLIPSQLEMNITKFVIQGKNLIRNQGNNFLRKRAIFMKFWRKLQWHIMQLIRIFFYNNVLPVASEIRSTHSIYMEFSVHISTYMLKEISGLVWKFYRNDE